MTTTQAPDTATPVIKDPADDPNLSDGLKKLFARRKDFFGVAGEQGLRRRQAAVVYPLLAPLFPARPMLRLSIDSGRPLAPAIQNMFALSKSATKRLANLDLPLPEQDDPVRDANMRQTVAKLIDDVPPDWMPKKAEDTQAFLEAIMVAGKLLPEATGAPASRLYKAAGGKWPQFVENLWKAAYPPERDGDAIRPTPPFDSGMLRNAARDVRAMVADFTYHALLPAVACATDDKEVYVTETLRLAVLEQAAQILFSKGSATDILKTAHRWGYEGADATQQEENEFVLANPRDNWAMLTDPVKAPNGYMLVPLNSAEKLKEESRHLEHCVGTWGSGRHYPDACALRGHHIVSVRGEGEPIATIEFDKPDGLQLRALQERGFKNRAIRLGQQEWNGGHWAQAAMVDPKYQKAAEAVDWYISEVGAGRIPVNTAQIERHRKAVTDGARTPRGEIDEIRFACNYDWHVPAQVEARLQAWAQWAPPGALPTTLPELIERVQGVQELVRGINPYAPLIERLEAAGTPENAAAVAPVP